MTAFLSAVLWNTSIASLLALFVGCLGRASWFRHRPAIMHALWIVVLARFVVPGIIPVPIIPVPSSTAGQPVKKSIAVEPNVSEIGARPSIEAAESVVDEVVTQPAAAVGIDRWPPFLVTLSGLISAIVFLRTAIHGIRFHQWLKSISQPDARLERLLAGTRAEMGCSRSPEVRSLAAPCVPFLWVGGRRACIFVPQTVSDAFDDEQLTGVLCHELAHSVRGDAWSNFFAFCVATVCWWNPLVWWARRELQSAQELCCDARVLERGERSRRAYAETLLLTLELVTRGVRLPSALASCWGESGSLKRRFQLIGETSVMSRLPLRFGVLALLLAQTSVVYPVEFLVTQNPDPEPHLNQPLVNQVEETAAVPEEPTTRIIGRIADPAGKPLAGMQIIAAILPPPPKRSPKPGRRMEWKLSGDPPRLATSDADGRFTIDQADPRATIMLQFDGAELQQPRLWKPNGSLATTISLKAAENSSELKVGYVPRNMIAKSTTVNGQVTREVTITWAPTRIIAHWGYAPTIEKWKEARALAEARDLRWKDRLLASDETVWVVPPGQYMRDEHNQHIDFGSTLQLGTSFGQGLRAGSEQEIILFFGALDPRTTKD